jgi:hypothetical protein
LVGVLLIVRSGKVPGNTFELNPTNDGSKQPNRLLDMWSTDSKTVGGGLTCRVLVAGTSARLFGRSVLITVV